VLAACEKIDWAIKKSNVTPNEAQEKFAS